MSAHGIKPGYQFIGFILVQIVTLWHKRGSLDDPDEEEGSNVLLVAGQELDERHVVESLNGPDDPLELVLQAALEAFIPGVFCVADVAAFNRFKVDPSFGKHSGK